MGEEAFRLSEKGKKDERMEKRQGKGEAYWLRRGPRMH
jgi:hypothetical protein